MLKMDSIIDYTEMLKIDARAIEQLEIKYNDKNRTYHLESYGDLNVQQPEDYYETIQDYLEYTYLSWLSPFINNIRKGITVNIPVLTDGTFSEDNVTLSLNIEFGDGVVESSAYAYRTFEKLSSFHKFIDFVEFKGNKHKLRNIVFQMSFNVRELSKVIQKSKPNSGIVNNWVYITDLAERESKNTFKLYAKAPVVNGKVIWNVRKEKLANVYRAEISS